MDRLWTPWRYQYISTVAGGEECVFCVAASSTDDPKHYVVLRAEHNFVLLNLYPYTSGHVLIAPYQHAANLEEAHPEALAEMMRLTARIEKALRQTYQAGGINLGMNIGQAAGAGIAGHIHMHVLPRWPGDVSFITTVGETRVLPEDLDTTYDKLKSALSA
jgi:ATP adenylyltransferase